MATVIPFNVPLVLGSEQNYVNDAIQRKEFSAGGHYTMLCENKLKEITQAESVLLTSSCTHALEMCAILLDIKEGDEVIMASFNFVSAANAFVLRGAKIIFVDIREDTLNIDENLIEEAISPKTKVILAMHYGGVSCNMNKIMLLAEQYNLFVVEDAAHCIGSFSSEKHLGTSGHLGALSFHATKNVHCGEGGALLINDPQLQERANVIREKGTNRKQFVEGKVQKYSWVDIGSSYLLSELSAAFLYAQLLQLELITSKRVIIAKTYFDQIHGPSVQLRSKFGNGHSSYLICKSASAKNNLIKRLKSNGILSYTHYVPLHSSKQGKLSSEFKGEDIFTTAISNRLMRLPIFFDLDTDQTIHVIKTVNQK